MNGAQSLVKTMLGAGVNLCFANPGTSEMHFVAALDDHPDMRCVLCLFEGGTTGAADGYFRMTGDVAATLLHLAPGFGNAFANVHNARKAFSGMMNVVGDHASYHLRYDSPLKGNVKGITEAVSDWVRVAEGADLVAMDGAQAIRAARSKNGQIASLILPANTAWEASNGPVDVDPPAAPHRPREDEVQAAVGSLKRPGAALLLGGKALHGPLAELAGKVAAATGCALLSDFLAPRVQRGENAVAIDSLKYVVEENVDCLKDISTMVLCGSIRPVSFFAYPSKPSTPEPADCEIIDLCPPQMDYEWTLQEMVAILGAQDETPARRSLHLPDVPTGDITIEKLGEAFAALLPPDAIVVDESVTSGRAFGQQTLHARAHDWLKTPGGAIGGALPCAVGASIACPDRQVFALTGDGSAMYTLQSLWTMAREKLDIVTIVFANHTYNILHGELINVGVEAAGRNAKAIFDLEDPKLDWIALARGHGVPGVSVTSMEAFADALEQGCAHDGPFLIEVQC